MGQCLQMLAVVSMPLHTRMVAILVGQAACPALRRSPPRIAARQQPRSTETLPPPRAPKRRGIHARRVKILRKWRMDLQGFDFLRVFGKDFIWHQ